MAKKPSTKSPLGVGVIGTGLMGAIHAEAITKSKNATFVGCWNRTREKADALAKKLGGKVYDTEAALLADPAIGAVSICTNQDQHARQVLAALKAGKHVLCEKPLALTPTEMSAIETALKKSGLTLMVAHQLRFHPVVAAVKKAMPKLGRCYHLDLEMCFRISGHEGRCWTTLRQGGFFMELGVHLADLSRHLMGPIDNVSGHSIRLNPKRATEDYTHALLQFESKAVGSIIVSANHRTTRQGLLIGRLLGEKGCIDFTIYPYQRANNSATLTLDGGKAVFVPDVTVTKLPLPKLPSPSKAFPGFFDVYDREVQAFVDAVRNGTAPPVTFEDGRSAVEVVLAVYDGQAGVTKKPNFKKRPASYRCEEAGHPLLRK